MHRVLWMGVARRGYVLRMRGGWGVRLVYPLLCGGVGIAPDCDETRVALDEHRVYHGLQPSRVSRATAMACITGYSQPIWLPV